MAKSYINHRQSSLHGALLCLTLILIVTQAIFFFIHLSVTELVDALAGASIFLQFIHPVVLIPLAIYLLLQISAYLLLISWVWFMAKSLGHLLRLQPSLTYWLGLSLWLTACLLLFALNYHYFPASFFSQMLSDADIAQSTNTMILIATGTILIGASLLALINFVIYRQYKKIAGLLLFSVLAAVAAHLREQHLPSGPTPDTSKYPNIILIGIDSLRPDFTSYFGNHQTHTPNIDAFLRQGTTYTNTYTPLARTFPAWVSILTAKHPLHNGARNNLINPAKPLAQDNLARRLQSAGYETIYASDEKRFSNITSNYGFDKLIGPGMGVHDFLLGGLTDFPMNNLLATLALGQYLFPYNFGNRAATITYEPAQFFQQLKSGLATRSNKPVFLAVHLCLTHWPFSWASDPQQPDDTLADQYHRSIEQSDADFGKLLTLLKQNRLLENSIVVLLSDHGTSLGLPNDRIISKKNYRGRKDRLKLPTVSKLSVPPSDNKHADIYTINTAYGQGTNVLSLKQYHVILSFMRSGGKLPLKPQRELTSLDDITPTILDYLALPPIANADGASLLQTLPPRKLMIETGDSFKEIETDKIHIDKVIKHEISAYRINARTGLLEMDEGVSTAIVKNKQLAILDKDWLLAHFPESERTTLAPSKKSAGGFSMEPQKIPAYFVLVNLKTGEWTIGLDTPFAKRAPTEALLKQLRNFYRGEI